MRTGCFQKTACGNHKCVCQKTDVDATEVFKIPTCDRWLLPPITPDPKFPGHYLVFEQLGTNLLFSDPDQHITKSSNGSCTTCR